MMQIAENQSLKNHTQWQGNPLDRSTKEAAPVVFLNLVVALKDHTLDHLWDYDANSWELCGLKNYTQGYGNALDRSAMEASPVVF